jgi:hypothetical protein
VSIFVKVTDEPTSIVSVGEENAYTLDLVDPPADLKSQVMNEIFSEPKQEFRPFSKNRANRQTFWFYSISTAVVLSIIIGTIWNYQLTVERQQILQSQMEQIVHPSRIEKLFPLSAQTNTTSAYAYGIACIVKQGDYSELVVYVYNVENNQGEEAYQVWLLNNSERTNAGTFQVGEDGIGVLTYRMDEQATFDDIGITLEPDSNGNTPRGKKMFGYTG